MPSFHLWINSHRHSHRHKDENTLKTNCNSTEIGVNRNDPRFMNILKENYKLYGLCSVTTGKPHKTPYQGLKDTLYL
jgi:hypothetical protein